MLIRVTNKEYDQLNNSSYKNIKGHRREGYILRSLSKLMQRCIRHVHRYIQNRAVLSNINTILEILAYKK